MITVVEAPIIKMLLNNDIDILIHGCTCQSSLPVGLGQEIEVTFPEVGRAHWRHYITSRRAKERMVGEHSEYFYKVGGRKYGVINLYSQVWPGPDFRETKMRSGLIAILRKYGPVKRSGQPIRYGMPVIGAEFGEIDLEVFKLHLKKVEDILNYDFDVPFNLTIVLP